MTRYETRTEPPNYYVRDLTASSTRAVTSFKDPHPQITAAERMFVTYKRKDGVRSERHDLPAARIQASDPGRLPMLVWAYPREFVDAAAASQVQGSPNRFTSVTRRIAPAVPHAGLRRVRRSDDADRRGPARRRTTRYVDQLVASAQAAVDKAVELGIADPKRVGVGGHSYGAFMTANLLAHSDIFAAGVARSGAYNRTLTPFGFQARRARSGRFPRSTARCRRSSTPTRSTSRSS